MSSISKDLNRNQYSQYEEINLGLKALFDQVKENTDQLKKLEEINEKVEKLYKLCILSDSDKIQYKKIVAFAAKTPLKKLIEEGILELDVDKMRKILNENEIDVNQKCYIEDKNWRDQEVTPIEHVFRQIHEGYSIHEALKMIDLLIEHGLKLDEEIVLQTTCSVSYPEEEKILLEYLVSKKDLFQLEEPLSPQAYNEMMCWGFNVAERAKYLLKLGVPIEKASKVFDQRRFFYGLEEHEAFDVLQIFSENSYCMTEEFEGWDDKVENALHWFIYKLGFTSRAASERIIRLLVPHFMGQFRDVLKNYESKEDLFEKELYSYEVTKIGEFTGRPYSYTADSTIWIGNVEYTKEEMERVLPFILDYDPSIFKKD